MKTSSQTESNVAPLLELKNIIVYRGNKRVLDRFSLTLPSQRNIAILGPNGAGKTTVLKLLMRELYPVQSPDLVFRIFGQKNWNIWELRENIGYISQDLQNTYGPHVSGLDVILSGFYASVGTYSHQQFSKENFAKAELVLQDLNITSLKDVFFSKMSTGEQRRFLLGRALVHGPDTLILDEPTSGLDPNATFHYLNTVRKLMRSGKQIVLVTHQLHEIPPEVDFVLLIKDGQVMSCGMKSDLIIDENLSALYDFPAQVIQANGFFQIVPAN